MAQWTTTYSGLVDAVGDYTEDASSELSSHIQGMINRAEERVLRDLDITYFDDRRSVTTSSGIATLTKTSDMIQVQSVRFTDNNSFALRRNYDYVKLYGGSGRPLYFYDDESELIFAPVPDDTYACEVKYLSRPTPLSTSNETNWLTSNVATLLLYATLKEAEHFLVAPERVAEFEQSYASNLGPARALWRQDQGPNYEPVGKTATPERTR